MMNEFIKNTFFLTLSLAAGFAAYLAGANLARASVTPACDDRELLRLQITASLTNLDNAKSDRSPSTGNYAKKVAVRHRDGSCEIMSVEVPEIDLTKESRDLDQARDRLKKMKASRSSNESAGEKPEVDVD